MKRPAATIDFSVLSSGLKVIGTTPSWEETKRAMERLELHGSRGQTYDEYQDDVGTVRHFAALLERSRETIYLALFNGALLGLASPRATFTERLLRGLAAISRRLHFEDRQMSDDRKRSALSALRERLIAEVPATPPLHEVALTSDDPAGWVESLKIAFETLRLPPGFLPERRERAWGIWQQRFDEHAYTPRDFDVEPEELWTTAGEMTPGSLFDPWLRAMKIRDWSRVLVASVQDRPPEHPGHCPLWLMPLALRELGTVREPEALNQFADRALSAGFSERQVSGEELARFQEWTKRIERPAYDPAALIVRSEAGSITDSWRVSSRIPALALTHDEIELFARMKWAEAHGLFSLIEIGVLVIELNREASVEDQLRRADELQRWLEQSAQAANRELSARRIFVARDAVEGRLDGPLVVRPPEIQAVFGNEAM